MKEVQQLLDAAWHSYRQINCRFIVAVCDPAQRSFHYASNLVCVNESPDLRILELARSLFPDPSVLGLLGWRGLELCPHGSVAEDGLPSAPKAGSSRAWQAVVTLFTRKVLALQRRCPTAVVLAVISAAGPHCARLHAHFGADAALAAFQRLPSRDVWAKDLDGVTRDPVQQLQHGGWSPRRRRNASSCMLAVAPPTGCAVP
jgi:hypothetical protein